MVIPVAEIGKHPVIAESETNDHSLYLKAV